jgi:hypothetical protein
VNPISQLMLAGAFAAGLALSLAGSMAWDRFVDDPAVERAARAEGILSERQAWEEARRRAEILKAQKLAEAQAKINAADQKLQDYQSSDRRRADAIRRAYEERLSNEKAEPLAGCDYSQCFVPDWVRKELE